MTLSLMLEGDAGSLSQFEERLSFFREVRGEFEGVTAADVLHRMDCSVRDEQDLAGLERHWRPAVELILQHAFDDVDELFTWMTVPGAAAPGGIPTSA